MAAARLEPARAVLERPAPISALPADLCRRLQFLFTDIDDTITSGGVLPPQSYQALWDMAAAGVQVIPVTGRPAGWCDHIARMWPVSAVIGENGAFYYTYDRQARKMTRRFIQAGGDPEGRAELARIAQRVLREVPGTALAADQPFRISDYAIDFCEDVPPLGPQAVDTICRVLAEEGVTFRVSSIHVNFWHGTFDKMTGVRAWLSDTQGGSGGVADALEQALFVGDSPNDEPLFAAFSHSIAVGNLARFLPRITSRPAYITRADSAEGFCEACRVIREKRRRSSRGARSPAPAS